MLPRLWKDAIVVPLHKGGAKDVLVNYRPVSLTSIGCKLMERIIANYIRREIEKKQWLTKGQHGFRKGHSCETQLLGLIEEISEVLDRGGEVDGVFVDFEKAFDKVQHSKLMKKVDFLIEDKRVVRWVSEFLKQRRQRVRVGEEYSEEADVTSGVPQGSVLGPLLFIIYINDIEEGMKSKVRLFADDCIIYREIRSNEDEDKMQGDLGKLGEWIVINELNVNVGKCKWVRFTRKREEQKKEYLYLLRGENLERVCKYKYLGVWIEERLLWGDHINVICKKGKKLVNLVMRGLKGSSKKVKEMAYKSLVRPGIEYAGAAWDPYMKKDIEEVEKVQKWAARRVEGKYERWGEKCIRGDALVKNLGNTSRKKEGDETVQFL